VTSVAARVVRRSVGKPASAAVSAAVVGLGIDRA